MLTAQKARIIANDRRASFDALGTYFSGDLLTDALHVVF
jgi:hypothetical protein